MQHRPHDRYRKVWFDENWFEDFVLKEMDWSIDLLFSKSEFPHDKRKRGVFFYALHKYCGLSVTNIEQRYGQSYVGALIAKVRDTTYVDKDKISTIVQPYLPIKQFETYRDVHSKPIPSRDSE
jgi:hypothetical protein